eukprot:gene7521-11845_t
MDESQAAFMQAWKKLDADDERELIEMEKLLANFDKFAKIEKKETTEDKKASFLELDSFKGTVINFPLTGEDCQNIIDAVSSGEKIHYKFVLHILLSCVILFKKESDSHVKKVNIPKDGKLVVVGDLHGQLLDLLTIIKKFGLPSEKQTYIFNGDFVDRGAHCTEVLIILYSLKLAFPSYMFINRGNHEFENLNIRYGFEDEVHKKYDRHIFRLIQDTFKLLTLYTIINDKVLVLHGGLYQYHDVSLDELKSFKVPLESNKEKRSQTIIVQSLWSDPDDEEGYAPSDRGVGILFGHDVTSTFLKRNDLELVIRSHEMVDEGYEMKHNDQLITVFSASYYAGSAFNKGAVVVFNDKTGLKPDFFQYYASISKESNFQEETLNQLKERIFHHRSELFKEFAKLDPDHDSIITVDDWVKTLKTIIPVSVDWKIIQPYLTESFEGQIDYAQFLNRFVINVGNQVSSAFEHHIIQKMCVKLVENMGNLKEAFQSFDVNGDGRLSYSEFVNILKLYDLGLSEDQMLDFTASMDEDENGTIEFEEFENRFSVDFKLESTDEGLRKKLQDISKKLLQNIKEISKAFDEFDENGDGNIDFDEFVKSLEGLGFKYETEDLKSLFQIIDKDQSGSITIDEFQNSFSVVDEKSDIYTQNIIQKVCLAIYKGRHKLKHLFREMDLDGNNKIDVDEFTVGLDALGLTLEKPLTQQQIQIIFNAIDTDGSGEIDFDEFTNAFKLVDSGSKK